MNSSLIINGADGFIGKALRLYFQAFGYQIIAMSRSKKSHNDNLIRCSYDEFSAGKIDEYLEGDAILINLAGASIGAKAWTPEYKKEIIDSRILSTRLIVERINSRFPNARLINGSAVGFYGDRKEEELDESSSAGVGFLSEVCKQWEAEAEKINNKNNLCIARFGVVLGKSGGALNQMITPIKYFAGGPISDGSQYLAWIHLEDLVKLISHCIEKRISGIVNFTTPESVRYKDFVAAAAGILSRPNFIKTPAFMIKLILGERSHLVLDSQNVKPKVAIDSQFNFTFPSINSALQNLLL
jgi:uncharacterized protein (TIGR01777 family)